MTFSVRVTLLALSLLTGCAHYSNVPHDIVAPGPKQSIVVLNYKPVFFDPLFRAGTLSAEGTYFTPTDIEHYWKFSPTKNPDGFIVMQLPGDAVYALAASVNQGSLMMRSACEGALALVFKAPAGKVVYLGAVDALPGNDQTRPMTVDFQGDLEGARQYLATAFPALAPQLQHGTMKPLPMNMRCPGSVKGYTLIPGPNGQPIQLPQYK